ncbi:hypothetical protein PYCC9005_000972 [Savitreella phatthalungensis]
MSDDMSLRQIPPSPMHSPKSGPYRPPKSQIPSLDPSVAADYDVNDEDIPSVEAIPSLSIDLDSSDTAAMRREERLSTSLYYLRRAHRVSAYAFCGFAGIHFANTGIALLLSSSTAPQHFDGTLPFADDNLLAARALYHAVPPLVELLAVATPLAVHVVSGFGLRAVRLEREYRLWVDGCRGGGVTGLVRRWVRAFSWTSVLGYVVVPAVAAHVAVHRIAPVAADVDASSAIVAHLLRLPDAIDGAMGIEKHVVRVVRAVAQVGYPVLVAGAGWHMSYGLLSLLRWPAINPGEGKRRATRTRAVVAAGVTGVWMAALAKLWWLGPVVGNGFRKLEFDKLVLTIVRSLPRPLQRLGLA